jgi:hypothetical protein
MVEIIAAYILVEGGAGVEWWLLYIAVFGYKAYVLWEQHKVKNALIKSLGGIDGSKE